ncbi:MAG TPA: gluconate 2-dehydrogenase subunit 3 family protein [Candidatus Acidoferrum sp.]|nr:gluconate 2-dehydrogenase subunit 3 family protein [Candidatus Acidoferrum sp.]
MDQQKMMSMDRRGFLVSAGTGLGVAWLAANWPAAVSASEHAHAAATSGVPAKLEFLTAEEAAEVSAICARIIPTDETPGATEAGAVYFIDRVLTTVATDAQPVYRDGLPQFQEDFHAMFPNAGKFSAASIEQQDQFLHTLDDDKAPPRRRNRPGSGQPSFFETVRMHTIAAFLIDPESEYAGSRGGVGWQVIGREPGHSFQSPFGFYDKNYPGWRSSPSAQQAK